MSVNAETAATLLARKKKTRSGHRASTTRLVNQATTAMGEDIDADRLSMIQRSLAAKVKTLESLDEELSKLVPDDELEEEIQNTDEYMENVHAVVAKLNKMLRVSTTSELASTTGTVQSTTTAASTSATVPPTTSVVTIESPHTEPTAVADHPVTLPTVASVDPLPSVATMSPAGRVKLPKISLPSFDGDVMKWAAFWDSFNSAIHTNHTLSEIDKFNYLRSLLQGTAYDAIAGLALSAVNYQEAVTILRKRFGNKQLIISRHMEALLNVTAVTSDRHLRDLRRLYDQSEANIRSLKALGINNYSYGAMLSSVLLSRLPPDIRLIVSRKASADSLDMDVLLETFEQELTARERASSSTQPSTHRNHNPSHSSTSAFVNTAPGSKVNTTSGTPTCPYCQQSHSPTECHTTPNPNARKKVLQSNGCCFNCLRKGHLSRNCRSSNRCKRCHGKHHTSICEKGFHSREQPNLSNPVELNPDAPAYTPSSTTSAVCSTKGRAILLQTARAVIYNPVKQKRTVEVRLLFDSGSQRSYLTERAMKLLELVPTGEQTLAIATFGATQEQTKVCPIVHVGIRLKGYPNAALSLHVVPTICEPLSCQPITASAVAYKKLDLADSAELDSRLLVDILIGCDHYWDLVTGDICRGNDGLVAIHTKLGGFYQVLQYLLILRYNLLLVL